MCFEDSLPSSVRHERPYVRHSPEAILVLVANV
jgi:hypothetical protein